MCGGSFISNDTYHRIFADQIEVDHNDIGTYGLGDDFGSLRNSKYFGDEERFPRAGWEQRGVLSGTYLIHLITVVNTDTVKTTTVRLNRALTADDRAALSIKLCDKTLKFSEATLGGTTYQWTNTGLDWSNLTPGDRADIYFKRPEGTEDTADPYYGIVNVSIGVARDLVAPRPASSDRHNNTNTVKYEEATLSFDDLLDEDSTPATSAFTVRLSTHPGGGNRNYPNAAVPTVEEVIVEDDEVQLILDRGSPQFGGFRPTIIVDYTPPATSPLVGENGIAVRAFSGWRLHNTTPDLRPSADAEVSSVAFSDAGSDNLWTNGETLTITYTFTAPVTVSGGTLKDDSGPWVAAVEQCGGNSALYRAGDGTTTGSGTNTLVFACTIANGPHESVGVRGNSLTEGPYYRIWTTGTTIPPGTSNPDNAVRWYKRVNGGHEFFFSKSTAARAVDPPEIVGAPSLSAEGPDGQWTPGETVEATLTFSEAVVVDTAGGTPTVELLLGGTAAKSASYLRGSGSETLVFGYTLTDDDGTHTSMMLSIDSLALNGGTIRSQSSGFDALLTHQGAAKVALPASARSSEGAAGAGAAVTTAEDTAYAFRPSDFGFSDDAKRDRNAHVTIATLPEAGSLSVDGSPARQHQIVDKTAIGSGALVFTPAANAHGEAYAGFQFRAYDGRSESPAATMTVGVTPENDPATGAPEIAGSAEAGRTATASPGSVSDPDGTENAQYAYRWIRVADGAETPIEGATGPRYLLGADDVGHRVKVAVSFTDDDGTAESAGSAAWPAEGVIAAASGIAATFSAVPESHDGSTEFTLELRFSEEPPGLSYRTVGGSLLETTNATVRGARRLTPGSNLGWLVTVRPRGPGDVSLTLPVRDCSRTNAICVGARALGEAVSTQVPYAAPQVVEAPPADPLTASFSQVPAAHDGSTEFTVELRFSEEPPGLSYRTVGGSLLETTNAAVGGARRLTPGSNLGWLVTVRPQGLGDVSLTLPVRECSRTNAICVGGRALAAPVTATVRGPVTLSVADARVREAEGATLGFTVSLSRAASGAVTVDYATGDGSATAGADYTATSGTLAFAAGETAKTVEVPVLDDAHDEGEETLTFTLSNPSPSSVTLADASATGTIENTDAMPQAWLARFGRTVADQVLDAVESRMRAGRAPGVELSLAGEHIGWRPDSVRTEVRDRRAGEHTGWRPDGIATEARDRRAGGNPAAGPAWGSTLPADRAGSARLTDRLRGAAGGHSGDGWSRSVTERELLLGSSFSLAAEAGGPGSGGGTVALWGRGAVSRFDGRDGTLSVDGEVASGMFGADWSRGPAMAGLILGHSIGEGGYRAPRGGGTVSSTLTGLYPWGRYALSERIELWGAAGYGEGSLTLTPEGQDAMRTDLDLWMAAAGLRGVLIEGGADGLTLAAKTDAMRVTTATDAAPGLAASEGEATRLRLGLEGTLPLRLADGSVLTPGLEIGLRRDGGDAETGSGADIGGRLAWRDARRGIAAELRGCGLLTHEAEGFRDRALAGSLNWEPGEGGRGPRASLVQTFGGPSSGGADALLAQGTLAGLAANEDSGGDLESRRLEARVGYGFAAFAGRFTLAPELGVGFSNAGREYSLGWRLIRVERGSAIAGGSLELSFEATRRESSANDNIGPEHGVGVRLGARF